MERNDKILIAGANGLVGKAIVRNLKSKGYNNLLTPSRDEVDYSNQEQTRDYFYSNVPDFVFVAAAKVGGIVANKTYPADFIYQNLAIQTNIIHSAYLARVKKLLFLGSSCIYPRDSPQPIKEEYLLTSSLEETNKPYAIAKIAGLTMCESYAKQYGCNFICAMPTNLYGPYDNFDLKTSHVIPALIRKFHEAKQNNSKVEIWGSGKPKREFLHVDDLAEACYFLMENYDDPSLINVGSGVDISIHWLAVMIGLAVDYDPVNIVYNTSKPDGTPRKLLDTTRINKLGWYPKIDLAEGLESTYDWFMNNYQT